MISARDLFDALVPLLPDDVTWSFDYADVQIIDGEVETDLVNAGAIYFRGGPNPTDRDLSTGKYKRQYYRLDFNIYSDFGVNGVIRGNEICSKICDTLDTIFNHTFNVNNKTGVFLNFVKTGNFGKVGVTRDGVSIFSFSYILQYS